MKLHVISFQVPFPADFGGAIDVYYKLKTLKKQGFNVVLHCFQYDRSEHKTELMELCEEVFYYERPTGLRYQFSALPYIVATRKSERLLQNLMKDNAPILFEGLHCCHLLDHPSLQKRQKFVRMHNIEHTYYRLLAKQNPWSWKSLYYIIEALKLKAFEKKLQYADRVLAISHTDAAELKLRYPDIDVRYVPCFSDTQFVNPEGDTDSYLLYHGNLTVQENLTAIDIILQALYVKEAIPYKLIIAGRNPSEKLKKRVEQFSNVEVIANPSDPELDSLLTKARVNLMITMQPTGVKLKLINALTKSRGHIIANESMLSGNDMRSLCSVVKDGVDLRNRVLKLMKTSPTVQELKSRAESLSHLNDVDMKEILFL